MCAPRPYRTVESHGITCYCLFISNAPFSCDSIGKRLLSSGAARAGPVRRIPWEARSPGTFARAAVGNGTDLA